MYKKSSAKAWRKYTSRYALTGSVCTNCDQKYYDQRSVCGKCGGKEFDKYEFSPDAIKLVSWSEVQVAGTNYEEFTPYIVAIIELEKDLKITGQLVDVDNDNLNYGDKLRPVFRKVYSDGHSGLIHYSIKFTK